MQMVFAPEAVMKVMDLYCLSFATVAAKTVPLKNSLPHRFPICRAVEGWLSTKTKLVANFGTAFLQPFAVGRLKALRHGVFT